MDIKTLSKTLGVSAQIQPGDVPAIRDAGYSAIICNRPDGEEPGQPSFAEVAAAAQAAGLKAVHIPVVGGQIEVGQVTAFADALEDLPQPVLAYCRSGARSSTLWSLITAAGHSSD